MTYSANQTTGTQKYVIACGDSITAAGGGWRTYLQVMIRSANKKVMWMGSQSSGQPAIEYPLHNAVSGYRIDQIAALLAGFTPPNTPDIIFIHAGSNDLNQDYDLANINVRYLAFVDAIFARWPSVNIVATKVGQFFGAYSALNTRNTSSGFNAAIAALPGSHAKGSQIKIADVNAMMNHTSYLHDGLHPTAPNGLTLTARAMWAACRTLIG